MPWNRRDRWLELGDGLATLQPVPGGGVVVEVFGVTLGLLDVDLFEAQARVERLVAASGQGKPAAAEAGHDEAARDALDELERLFGRA